jgi:hypothetical protein
LELKATFESDPAHLSFKSIDPGAFNTGLIGSTCTTLPWTRGMATYTLALIAPAHCVVAQVEFESKL